MSVLPISELPPEPDVDVDLPTRPLVQPRPVPDPAIRWRVLVDGEAQSPATVHIAPKRRAA